MRFGEILMLQYIIKQTKLKWEVDLCNWSKSGQLKFLLIKIINES